VHRVDTDGLSIEEVVARLLELIRNGGEDR